MVPSLQFVFPSPLWLDSISFPIEASHLNSPGHSPLACCVEACKNALAARTRSAPTPTCAFEQSGHHLVPSFHSHNMMITAATISTDPKHCFSSLRPWAPRREWCQLFQQTLAQFLMLILQILYQLSHPPVLEKGTIVLNDCRQESCSVHGVNTKQKWWGNRLAWEARVLRTERTSPLTLGRNFILGFQNFPME